MTQSKPRSSIGLVQLGKMRIRNTGLQIAQRDLRPHHAKAIGEAFHIDYFGIPAVNRVGDTYWVIDGQQRIEGFKEHHGLGWEGLLIRCEVFENLSLKEEAQVFMGRNTYKLINAFDKYRVALTAGCVEELAIDSIVRQNGLRVSRVKGSGCVTCVKTLRKAFDLGGGVLNRTLSILGNAFGDVGLEADLIGGMSLVVERYGDRLNDARAVTQLRKLRGGINALRSRATTVQKQTGSEPKYSTAAVIVAHLNKAPGRKLPDWWRD